ncbi:membrane-bound lytic murein transglycosylase MltF [Aeromonas cavernicola]|uniref:Membrane-bound lytic murein transglycosylase F n=1 Tax=Aeromonas cavernicola TaxID=1006623 RepID=A0A2H9U5W8_9GAMM|nr:membrane-bound lytic murein transglycosylase MltF [Aeromonas cavernicola]PJG59427.1 membrane-bound lytic murein transglycosylase MltF [Aeromonas cavernicola]
MSIFSTKASTHLHLIFQLFLGLLLTLSLVGCEGRNTLNQLEQIRQRGEIRVGTLYGPTSYYQRDEVAQGFDYELAQSYADWLGVTLSIVPVNSTHELLDLLQRNKLDLAAAALMVTPERRAHFRFGPGFYQVSPKLVYRNGSNKPASLAEVNGNLMVAAGSSAEDLLKAISKQHPSLTWRTHPDADVEELLKKVSDGEIDYTVVQDTVLARTQRYYPELAEGLTLAKNQTVAWAMNRRADDSLYASVIDFFGQRFMDGAIAKLDEKYFGHVQNFDFVDTRTFLQRAKSLLPKYQALFQTHAREMDWRLLAAISYQESHWDPQARSATGVRGMMMLTNPTAKAMGVNDRTHPEESIKGGALYLQQMMAKVPDSVQNDEKVWFALTAYNIGYGHMMDALRLTKSLGKNPDAWSDVKEVLPLLQQSRWHRKVRFGYARGSEARNYVNNVRQYYQSLLWLDNERQKAQQRERLDNDSDPESSTPPARPTAIADIVTQITRR